MSTSIWRPDLATGIPDIDRQHEQLLANVAALRTAARTGDVALAEGVLAYLERYAGEHFAAEEQAMWRGGYPDLDAHWSLHLAFATELARRQAEYRGSPARAALLADLGRWMDDWLEEHVQGADAEMARFLRSAAARFPARVASV
jgi:hemerythrin